MRRLEKRGEAVPVRREELVVEVGRDAVESPRRRVALVAARHEPSALAPEVDEQGRVAQRRHVAGQVRTAW